MKKYRIFLLHTLFCLGCASGILNAAAHDKGFSAISGYLRNPLSPHIALVLTSVSFGMECDDRYFQVEIVGCHLQKGFYK
jgi:hypothetical protein